MLNQEIEMGQLLTKVLGDEIEKQNVIVQADDGQVEEALKKLLTIGSGF